MVKTCPKCKTIKHISEFYKNRPSGSSYCKRCSVNYCRETYDPQKKHKRREKIKDKLNLKKREKRIITKNNNMKWLLSFLGTKKIHCDNCKYDKSFDVIQFHHINPSQKEKFNDSLALWLNHCSLEKFQEKILNTDFLLLCANCHIELHSGLWKYE
jgi:hypothetical protein